jgi:hypothetical protein
MVITDHRCTELAVGVDLPIVTGVVEVVNMRAIFAGRFGEERRLCKARFGVDYALLLKMNVLTNK